MTYQDTCNAKSFLVDGETRAGMHGHCLQRPITPTACVCASSGRARLCTHRPVYRRASAQSTHIHLCTHTNIYIHVHMHACMHAGRPTFACMHAEAHQEYEGRAQHAAAAPCGVQCSTYSRTQVRQGLRGIWARRLVWRYVCTATLGTATL